MGFGEPVQQRIKSMRTIDFKKENAQDREVDKKTFSKDKLCTCTRQAHICHVWLKMDTPDVSFLRVTFNGNRENQMGTLILFQKRNHLNIWSVVPCFLHTGRDYKFTFTLFPSSGTFNSQCCIHFTVIHIR